MEDLRETPKGSGDYPKEVILKDGTGITLRPLEEQDTESLFRMFSRFSDDDRWFLTQDTSALEEIKRWVTSGEEMKRTFSLVALLEGRIIASATLLRQYHGARNHIGCVEIAVDPYFRKRHLATWMLLDLVNVAMDQGLEIVVMCLVERRDSSFRRNVEKLEFKIEAALPGYIKDRGGNHYDLIMISKHIRRVTAYCFENGIT
jgi:RimJ/RimL family protein N-acetyltransferase